MKKPKLSSKNKLELINNFSRCVLTGTLSYKIRESCFDFISCNNCLERIIMIFNHFSDH